jgi:hypothetical protein
MVEIAGQAVDFGGDQCFHRSHHVVQPLPVVGFADQVGAAAQRTFGIVAVVRRTESQRPLRRCLGWKVSRPPRGAKATRHVPNLVQPAARHLTAQVGQLKTKPRSRFCSSLAS